MAETEIGTIEHYFDRAGVAAINITTGELSVGDTVHIKGNTTDVTTKVESMQIEHESVQTAKVGDGVGVKIGEKVRQHDTVLKVTED
jgi:putative protease